jgi:iron complex transport system ATP-binding protein
LVSAVATKLEARELGLTYPSGAHALDAVSLEVGAGELVAVVGPNGSGKSTLLRCLGGLLAPTAGRVLLDGRDVHVLEATQRARRLAFVPQYLPAVPDVRVDDFVLGGRYAHIDRWRGPAREDLEQVQSALAACDALDLAPRALTELSGGQRQRVLIARAVAQAAPVVLVDEPTAALDPAHQVSMFALLARFAREGRAVIVATHELGLSSRAANRMCVLQGGRVRVLGAPRDVLEPQVLREVYGPDLHIEARDGGVIVAPWPRAPG